MPLAPYSLLNVTKVKTKMGNDVSALASHALTGTSLKPSLPGNHTVRKFLVAPVTLSHVPSLHPGFEPRAPGRFVCHTGQKAPSYTSCSKLKKCHLLAYGWG